MIRLGILGHSRVAEMAVCRPARRVGGFEVAAVAGRDAARAADFARRHGIPRSFASVGELLDAGGVDAVYVCLPHHLHARTALEAAEAGKHVLVEKPLALAAADAAPLPARRDAAGVVVAEALMAQHHPWQGVVRELLRAPEMGPVERVETRICFPLAEERIARLRPPAQGGGAFCDVAPYWLQFLQTTVGLDVKEVEAEGSFAGPAGADLACGARLALAGGVTAGLHAGYLEPYAATHTVRCAGGTLTVQDFLRPVLGDYQVRIVVEVDGEPGPQVHPVSGGGFYDNQLRAFLDLVSARGAGPDPLAPALQRVAVMERVYRQACAAAGVQGP